MPNKFGRSAGAVDPYRPHGLLPDGLLPVSRPDGSEDLQLANAANKVANTFGTMADEFAAQEGKAAGTVAGADKDFRPTESLTIRGRAYDEAAIKTYKDNLDAQLRTDIQKVYEANKNDPDALTKGFDTLGEEYRAQHVFPAIAGEFNASFARLRIPYQNKALSDLEDAKKDERKGALINNITASQTFAARAASADPTNPNTAAVVSGEATRIDTMIDGAVADKTISAEQAAKLKISNWNTITTRAATAQAESLKSPDEVAQYRVNARKQFAAGKFKNLTADGFEELDAKLEQIQKAKKTEANAGETLLQKNVNDYVQRAADGFPLPADEWTRYSSSAGASTPKGQAILQEGEAKLQVANLLKGRSIEDGERFVSRMRAEMGKDGEVTERQAEVVRFAEKYIKDQRTALNTDQLGLAERKRLVPAVAPLDFQQFATSDSPDAASALAVQFRNRTSQARSVATEFQRAPQFLRPEEKDRLKEIVDRGGPKALALAGAIVKGADADAPMILKEISDDAPLLAQAGNIIANGGSLSAARDAFQAGKIKAETGKELPGVSSTVSSRAQRDEFGTAFSYQGADGGRIRATADAIARVRLDRGGVDPKSSEAEKIFKRSLQEAAGATFVSDVQYGGVADYKPGYWSTYKVPVPAGVRADAFRDVIRSIRDTDLRELPVPPIAADGRPYSARDLAGAVPIAVKGGYRFAMGDPASNDPKFVRGADGNPFVYPFDSIQQLMPRVPGAFLGGR